MAVGPHSDSTHDAEHARLATLYDLLAALSRATAIEDVYSAAIDSLLAATHAHRAAVLGFDPEGGMQFKAWRDLSFEYRQAFVKYRPWGKGAQNPRAAVFPDVMAEESLQAFREVFLCDGIRAFALVPITAETELSGAFMLHYSEVHECSKEELAIAQDIGTHVALSARAFEQTHWVQTELKQSNEELRRANQDLETFAYSASHDLQEPLRTIAISAQLLERRCRNQLQGDSLQFLDNILQGAQRMETLIQDILAYATATQYAEGSAPSIDSGRVLAIVLENLQGAITEAGATITSGELPAVSVHEGGLVLLFQNLIANALVYRRETPRIHISAADRDGWLVFSIADNGIGIESKFADHIFGLFRRLHGRSQYPGTGVGLAICQRIVERYGGRIWLEASVPGEGSTFCFSFPTRAPAMAGRFPV